MKAVNELVIVGRDAALWLSACVMQEALGQSAQNPGGLRIVAVELPGTLAAADVCAALPALEPLHVRLRIDERKLLGATRGAFTLGRHFRDTTGKAADFFHAYGSTGARIDNIEFLPQWIRARRHGLPVAYEDFCLTAVAAKHGRMLLPDAVDSNGFTDYGYHLPAIPYAAWLKQLALRRGVLLQQAREASAQLHAETGDLEAVLLDGDRRIAGDFFIDASGEQACLSGGLGVAHQSWREFFPADRLLVAIAPPMDSLPVYADVRAGESGWLSLQPSLVCTHVSYAFGSETRDDAALSAATALARCPLQAAQIRARKPGRQASPWARNCVAIGDSAGVFDAMHGVDLQAVQLGLVHLLPLFPVCGDFDVERDEYNQNLAAAFERLRDFQSAHYVLNRYGGAFWERARLTPVSAALMRKIGVFRARGEVAHYEDESFSVDDWQQLLLGHGVMPESWDPAVDRTSSDVVHGELRRILGFIRQTVERQQSHTDYLRWLSASAPSSRPGH